jgi:hypothetical protein
MFRVHEAQLAWFGDKARRDFVARMSAYLERHFAQCVRQMTHEEVSAWVSEATAKAERYGITTEPEVAQLVLLFLVLGVDADETTPWVKEALDTRGLYPAGKVRKLVEAARERGATGVEQVLTARFRRAFGEEITPW